MLTLQLIMLLVAMVLMGIASLIKGKKWLNASSFVAVFAILVVVAAVAVAFDVLVALVVFGTFSVLLGRVKKYKIFLIIFYTITVVGIIISLMTHH